MCGIVGVVAERNVLPILVEGLRRLEYRGYDSAGVAVVTKNNEIERVRAVGKVQALADRLKEEPITGSIGIAHTRWATHGKPSEVNAHPHVSGENIAIVHNGIIENFAELKKSLQNKGIIFNSETDTEVIVHLLNSLWDSNLSPIKNIKNTVAHLRGAYGLVVLHKDYPDRLIAVRSGSPIVIGYGLGEHFLSSDCLSLLPVTRRFSYLEEGDMAVIKLNGVEIYDKEGVKKEVEIAEFTHTQDAACKGEYKHYMQKEIFEQPTVIANTFSNCITRDNQVMVEKFGAEAEQLFKKVKHVRIVACGTSYHAGLVARYWIESYANITCDVEIASEIRYRKAVVPKDCLFINISQSGETADTLAALRQAKELGYLATLAICNVPSSSLVREADLVFITQAGIEMSVASTKAFTTQLVAFILLTCAIGRFHGLSTESEQKIIKALVKAPELVQKVLSLDSEIEKLSYDFVEKDHALFLGRGIQYPVALEGALKLKEVSYIHAEAYPAGELKHGPLALVDKDMPVIAVAPNDALLEKLEGNLQEVQARGGQLYVFIDHAVSKNLNISSQHTFVIEEVPEIISPIVFTIPLQLFSYHVAVQKGTDVDQPRNLAKSVTVE
ncbi:MAG: glucosamine--fructose-6-phosphate aminotransferase (isomerizing) [Francisellaceae bacterium]|jgi:glucosamine--fructose-6-phosphate aminotransferase (isomerizing)